MAPSPERPPLLATLRTRVLLMVVGVFAVLLVPAYFIFERISSETTLTLGSALASKQAQYDRYRGMAALDKELTLAGTLARDPAIMDWADNEFDPDVQARGLAAFEHYRAAFTDRSAFIVLDASGNYYFNDAQQSYSDDPYRYTVRSDNPRDGWYFTTRARGEGCYLNVDHDDVLRLTNVWINCVINREGRVLGIVGTGINLSAFIREVVDIDQPGIESMFVDATGAVQAHPDASLVDFHSLTKDIADQQTIFAMLDTEADRTALTRLMEGAREGGEGSVPTAMVSLAGSPMLVGVGYLGGIDWYNVTLMDPDVIVGQSLFQPVGGLALIVLLAAALGMTVLFKTAVLDRLETIEAGIDGLRQGKRGQIRLDRGNDEIGRLSRTLVAMVSAVTASQRDLERQVKERTEDLEDLVNRDSLTGIFNRRGVAQGFADFSDWARQRKTTIGLILIDVDGFKAINDSLGHATGDAVLIALAERLSQAIRRSDLCGRWGGDEFVVVIRGCDAAVLNRIAGELLEMTRTVPVPQDGAASPGLTASIGACVVSPGESLQRATDLADQALYRAKHEGRDRAVIVATEDDDTARVSA
ncbi:sensor domain-containing diguanylate cyclase [Pelagibacterium montanilacus]|uniref:sensor domain-containing diguanylate cyclase n=1 Tax=Pelagibacterium montanilacus TaxID=2185280 RepID=UPI000F8E0E0D|nr:sensor domain-containing diguanylate cyclase [Pelagibacterium montanilacus]